MGALEHAESGERVSLHAWHVVGRSRRSDLVVDEPEVSAKHALLRWTGSSWFVRDLGSRNGTFVNGKRLEPGEDHSVRVGDTVSFAEARGIWRLASASAPEPMAVPVEGGATIKADGGLILLPPDEPEACVFRDELDQWWCERRGEVERVDDGSILLVAGSAFKLHLPTQPRETASMPESVTLSFKVSLDQEHVEVTARWGATSMQLKPRSHHHLLLTLARARVEDASDPELPEAEHGWRYRDEVEKMLAIDRNVLYVHTFRARQELGRLGAPHAADVVEWRRDTGQLRLGDGFAPIVPE